VKAAMCSRDLHAIFYFCTIGFLVTMNVVVRFPDFGQMLAELAIFP